MDKLFLQCTKALKKQNSTEEWHKYVIQLDITFAVIDMFSFIYLLSLSFFLFRSVS